MKQDIGVFTDCADSGPGTTDVSFSTQQSMRKKMYNGTEQCEDCGINIDPPEALAKKALGQMYCYNCKNRRDRAHVQRGMI